LCISQEVRTPDGREWGKQAGSFQLSIGSDRRAYGFGETVTVTATLKNVSMDQAWFARQGPVELYDMQVLLPVPSWLRYSQRAPLTPLGREMKYPRMTSTVGNYIPAGHEVVDKFELNKLYDMRAPGDYHIVFSCKLRPREGEPVVTVVSNEITVRVGNPQ
jgi:hypothetical protein